MILNVLPTQIFVMQAKIYANVARIQLARPQQQSVILVPANNALLIIIVLQKRDIANQMFA